MICIANYKKVDKVFIFTLFLYLISTFENYTNTANFMKKFYNIHVLSTENLITIIWLYCKPLSLLDNKLHTEDISAAKRENILENCEELEENCLSTTMDSFLLLKVSTSQRFQTVLLLLYFYFLLMFNSIFDLLLNIERLWIKHFKSRKTE